MVVGGALGVILIGVWIFCVIDTLTTPAEQVRNLPKLAWVAIVVLLFEIGALAWLIAGRPWGAKAPTPGGSTGGGFAGLGTSAAPARRRGPGRPVSPDDDDEFLASLNQQIKKQKKDGDGGPAEPSPA
ncbi:PLD nuclease N-terminal domain-containing protein [Jatrophihabitans fulvus]